MNKAYGYGMIGILIWGLGACQGLPTAEELNNMTQEERWAYLEEGQSLEEVHHLLGEPIRTLQKRNITLDQYDCALCLTKVDKNSGLLAWNPPVKGFEEEAELLYMGEPPTNWSRKLLKSLPSLPKHTFELPSKQEIEEALNDVRREIEALKGEKGEKLLRILRKQSEEGLQELQRFLEEDIGENAEEWRRVLEQNWEEHGPEIIEQLEQLTQELKNLKEEENYKIVEEEERPTTRAEQWIAIREGMTMDEVVAVLGEPNSVKQWSGNTRFTYECFNCTVTFDRLGRVWAWNSPEL
jgi:outer membrane protein assembly factor BamE (lipoprotein component of BamABCDE complex)